MFDFVHECLPESDLNQLRYYNRRSFLLFDRYLELRAVEREISDNVRGLLRGLEREPDLRSLLLKGAEKSYEEQKSKYDKAKSIET